MVELRNITNDEVEAFRYAIRLGFGQDSDPEELAADEDRWFLSVFSLADQWAAFDRGRMVATFGSYDQEITVPGGVLPMAGTTVVTVQPTHRRQGILTGLMSLHLNRAVEQGQPMAGLWASEETIYGRFGYGAAIYKAEVAIPATTVHLPSGPDDVSLAYIESDEAAAILPALYDRVRPSTCGWLARSPDWWAERHLRDQPHRRHGASAQRIVVAERAGRPVGYLRFRHRWGWDLLPDGAVEIEELVAVDDDVRRSLWHFAVSVDLYPNVTWDNCPVDDPVLIEADRYRAISVRTRESIWLRLLDVPAALVGRRYERDDALVIAVEDRMGLAAGTFRLEVVDGQATCDAVPGASPAAAHPDVTLDVSALGVIFAGGVSAHTLARARRIAGHRAAVLRLDQLFRTAAAPHASENF